MGFWHGTVKFAISQMLEAVARKSGDPRSRQIGFRELENTKEVVKLIL